MKKQSLIIVLVVLASTFYFSLTILPENVVAATHYVGGTGPGNFTRIQDAVDASNPGDEIFVYNGTYYEHITILEPLTLLGENRNTTIIDGSSSGTVVSVTANWVNITGFTVRNGGQNTLDSGIGISSSSGCYVMNNTVSNNWAGILLSYSSGNVVMSNIGNNNSIGIYVYKSNGNKIFNNTVHSNTDGIATSDSRNDVIANNEIFSNTLTGIGLYFSRTSTIVNNKMVEDGIHVSGNVLLYWNTHTIDASNTVNGKPVYFLKDTVGGTVPSGAGQVILANCKGMTVENQNVSNGTEGIQLGFSSGNYIANNTASSNDWYGIRVYSSNNNTIINNTARASGDGIRLTYSGRNTVANNTLSSNRWHDITIYYSSNNVIANNTMYDGDGDGIYHSSSDNNTITGNDISGKVFGIGVEHSAYNTFANNTVSDSWEGIHLHLSANNNIRNCSVISSGRRGINLMSSSGNRIYHNRISDNVLQAFDDTNANQWDNGYPSGGNYWSDYNGPDICSGPNQDICPDPDGIGDTPYVIDIDSRDRYPFVNFIVPSPSPTNLTTEFVGDYDILLDWTAPNSPFLDHYLIYRGVDQRQLDFSTPIYDTSIEIDPLRTDWTDVNASSPTAPREYYYTVRAVNLLGMMSGTSNTAGKWTKNFSAGLLTFSLPLEPFKTRNASWYADGIQNTRFIRWANSTGHWVTHYAGMQEGINDIPVEMGKGYEISLASNTRFTFCGYPASMIRYHEGVGDSMGFRKSLSTERDRSNVTLAWDFAGGASEYRIYKSDRRNGLHNLSLGPVDTVPSTQNTWTDYGVFSSGGEYYYIVIPMDSQGDLGSSTYSVGVFTMEYQSGSDSFALPLKVEEARSLDWYCDNIPNIVGMAYVASNVWKFHAREMPEGVYDIEVLHGEGYQISFDGGSSSFTFIGY